ncbi:P-loop NTPase fold protein [Psychrobacillus sp. FSL W7-1493]|uniref:KAP family P-loop NTPase fold protein n=1 Tax=Psychrobacillus sp. FSL W7-1493 TaxID=2921552 RepID=UPI0030FC2887
MFKPDNPIETIEDDVLDRKKFAIHLGNALVDWHQKESLVVALTGKWGSGKSSIINMAIQQLEHKDNKPLVVQYNPWIYSNLNDLTEEFFNELITNLKAANQYEEDINLIDKLNRYIEVLNLIPPKEELKENMNYFLIILGFIGISLSDITDLLEGYKFYIQWLLFGGGLLLLLSQLWTSFYSKYKGIKPNEQVTARYLKEQINESLRARNTKLVVVIDDIDRLTSREINDIFKLVKINADFKNTIYLLSFDQDVVSAALEDTLNVNGKEYLEKIIQVRFDVPRANNLDFYKYLFDGLNSMIDKLPEQSKQHFTDFQSYWSNIFNSGIKIFFKDIRNVKRFLNSLEFNISQLNNNGVMEINVIDFIAIESFRLFEPKLYKYISENKELFTQISSSYNRQNDIVRKSNLESAFDLIENNEKESVIELLIELFPPIKGVLKNNHYGFDWIAEWNSQLRICTALHFDSYFVYIPKGSSSEISQYELEDVFETIKSGEDLSLLFEEYNKKNKLKSLISLLEPYSKTEKFPHVSLEHILLSLFNLIGKPSLSSNGMVDVGAEWGLKRIIINLIKTNDTQIRELLIKALNECKTILGVVSFIETISKDQKFENLITTDQIATLRSRYSELILDKVKNLSILLEYEVPRLLYLYRQFGINQQEMDESLEKLIKEDELFVCFLTTFKKYGWVQSYGDYSSRKIAKLGVEEMKEIVGNSELLDSKVLDIKQNNINLYNQHRELIDLYLNPPAEFD